MRTMIVKTSSEGDDRSELFIMHDIEDTSSKETKRVTDHHKAREYDNNVTTTKSDLISVSDQLGLLGM